MASVLKNKLLHSALTLTFYVKTVKFSALLVFVIKAAISTDGNLDCVDVRVHFCVHAHVHVRVYFRVHDCVYVPSMSVSLPCPSPCLCRCPCPYPYPCQCPYPCLRPCSCTCANFVSLFQRTTFHAYFALPTDTVISIASIGVTVVNVSLQH